MNKAFFACTFGLLFYAACMSPAQASYVNSCRLEARVTQDAATLVAYANDGQGHEHETETDVLIVPIEILDATPFGRADSGCSHWVGQRTTIRIDRSPNMPMRLRLQQDQTIQIDAISKNSRLSPTTTHTYTFTLGSP